MDRFPALAALAGASPADYYTVPKESLDRSQSICSSLCTSMTELFASNFFSPWHYTASQPLAPGKFCHAEKLQLCMLLCCFFTPYTLTNLCIAAL
mmetsp:Transcript_1701/g.4910  ORF Transcript_1701/g.4910 Transcript_1701/m.4910 type:complete len:95 (-) Transcript_1701:32-316(-)